MSKPKFDYDGNTLQFSIYVSYPEPCGLQSRQRWVRTNSGDIRVQNIGLSDIRELTLNFQNMPDSDFTALENWCQNIIKWVTNPFQFTNHQGTVHDVRLLQTDLTTFQRNYEDNSSGTLLLNVTNITPV